MSALQLDHSKGLTITAIGGLALSFDVPLIKLADGDVWSILMLRTGSTIIATAVLWLIWRRIGNVPTLIPGRAGLWVAFFYALTSMCFITAIYHTSTANLVFILAFSTVFATALSWGVLKERPRPATLVAMGFMLAGVLLIVGDGISAGTWFGDLLALAASLFLACAITITRASGRDMGFTSLVAVSLPFVIAAFMVGRGGLDVNAPWWIILNGAIVMPIAFYCLATGPRYLTGPEVAMFYLLETVLAPIWVWMIFTETPTTRTLIGGAILIGALLAHSLWQIHDGRRRRAALALRHPM